MKAKDLFWVAFALFIFGYFVFKVAMNSFTDNFLGRNPKIVKAVIIDEKNHMGNSPVSLNFSYSYYFVVRGKNYTGNSHDTSLIVGDTVEVKYNIDYPSINKPLHPKE